MSISSVEKALSVGVALEDGRYSLVMCESGQATRRREFPVGAHGQAHLEKYLASFKALKRIALGATTAAMVTLGVALSALPRSEIYLVSPSIALRSVELAHYAKRSV